MTNTEFSKRAGFSITYLNKMQRDFPDRYEIFKEVGEGNAQLGLIVRSELTKYLQEYFIDTHKQVDIAKALLPSGLGFHTCINLARKIESGREFSIQADTLKALIDNLDIGYSTDKAKEKYTAILRSKDTELTKKENFRGRVVLFVDKFRDYMIEQYGYANFYDNPRWSKLVYGL